MQIQILVSAPVRLAESGSRVACITDGLERSLRAVLVLNPKQRCRRRDRRRGPLRLEVVRSPVERRKRKENENT